MAIAGGAALLEAAGLADLNWPGLALAYGGYRAGRAGYTAYRDRGRNNISTTNNMPGQRRPRGNTFGGQQPRFKRRAVAGRFRNARPSAPYRRIPRALGIQRGVVYDSVFHMVKYPQTTVGDGIGNIPGMVKPSDILACGKLARYLNNYEWIKLHSMSVEWVTTDPIMIMSMYDSSQSSHGTTEKLEPYFERQATLRIHRSDRNGLRKISRTESLKMKPGFQDYIRTGLFDTAVEANTNQCSIKFLGTNSHHSTHFVSGFVKFKISAYGVKDTQIDDTNAMVDQIVTE